MCHGFVRVYQVPYKFYGCVSGHLFRRTKREDLGTRKGLNELLVCQGGFCSPRLPWFPRPLRGLYLRISLGYCHTLFYSWITFVIELYRVLNKTLILDC